MAEEKPTEEVKYIASARTALVNPESALYKPLTEEYKSSTVGDVLKYLTSGNKSSEDLAMATSLKEEMSKRSGYTITANNRAVKSSDKVSDLFVEKEHAGVKYQALDFEISSVQEGGLVKLL